MQGYERYSYKFLGDTYDFQLQELFGIGKDINSLSDYMKDGSSDQAVKAKIQRIIKNLYEKIITTKFMVYDPHSILNIIRDYAKKITENCLYNKADTAATNTLVVAKYPQHLPSEQRRIAELVSSSDNPSYDLYLYLKNEYKAYENPFEEKINLTIQQYPSQIKTTNKRGEEITTDIPFDPKLYSFLSFKQPMEFKHKNQSMVYEYGKIFIKKESKDLTTIFAVEKLNFFIILLSCFIMKNEKTYSIAVIINNQTKVITTSVLYGKEQNPFRIINWMKHKQFNKFEDKPTFFYDEKDDVVEFIATHRGYSYKFSKTGMYNAILKFIQDNHPNEILDTKKRNIIKKEINRFKTDGNTILKLKKLNEILEKIQKAGKSKSSSSNGKQEVERAKSSSEIKVGKRKKTTMKKSPTKKQKRTSSSMKLRTSSSSSGVSSLFVQ